MSGGLPRLARGRPPAPGRGARSIISAISPTNRASAGCARPDPQRPATTPGSSRSPPPQRRPAASERVRRAAAATTSRGRLSWCCPAPWAASCGSATTPSGSTTGRLLKGGLKRLAAGRDGIAPVGLVDQFYGPLVEFLARSHQVEIFPYDWRYSVRQAAARLAKPSNRWSPRPSAAVSRCAWSPTRWAAWSCAR
jgi:hypothetical protein